jgi:predicted DNA-binding transcriptional regulator AlpA
MSDLQVIEGGQAMKDPTYENRLLMPHELARILGVSISWVRTHAAPSSKCRIPTKKVGNLLRFDLQEVMNWINRQQTPVNPLGYGPGKRSN